MESEKDVETNTNVQDIIKNIQLALEKLEKSSFYAKFKDQMQNPEMVARIERVIGTDPVHSKLQVVLYGVGRMEPSEETPDVADVAANHLQLCLAILLRENFELVHDIVVYDPVHSTTEKKAINAFDCNCLSVNENGRREVNVPTLFFMPRCDVRLIDRVLQANWSSKNLNKIIILGNSFNGFELDKKHFQYQSLTEKIPVILDSDNMLHEMPLPRPDISSDDAHRCSIESVYRRSFHGLSWHFFDWDGSLHGFQKQDPEMFAPDYEETNRMVEEISMGQEKLAKSSFYRKIIEKMQDTDMVTRIETVIGSDPHDSKLQVVLHGIGMKTPTYQMLLAFAILLREEFQWVRDIVVYVNPSFSTVKRKAFMKAFNCSFLTPSEHGRWSVDRPTLFFIPVSETFRYINIVEANWTPAMFNRLMILGQSFKDYALRFCSEESNVMFLKNEQILHEMPLPQTADIQHDGSTPPNRDCSIDPDAEYLKTFTGLSWHFFRWDRSLDDIDRNNVRSFFGSCDPSSLQTDIPFCGVPHFFHSFLQQAE